MLERMFERQSDDDLSSRWRQHHADAIAVVATTTTSAAAAAAAAAAAPVATVRSAMHESVTSSMLSIDWSVESGSPPPPPVHRMEHRGVKVRALHVSRPRPPPQQQPDHSGLELVVPAAPLFDVPAMPVGL